MINDQDTRSRTVCRVNLCHHPPGRMPVLFGPELVDACVRSGPCPEALGPGTLRAGKFCRNFLPPRALTIATPMSSPRPTGSGRMVCAPRPSRVRCREEKRRAKTVSQQPPSKFCNHLSLACSRPRLSQTIPRPKYPRGVCQSQLVALDVLHHHRKNRPDDVT